MTDSKRLPMAEGLIALVTLLFLLFLSGSVLVGPPAVDPDHPFDTAATLDRLERILGDETPHPADSVAGDAVITRIQDEIRALGFEPTLDDAFHCNSRWGGGSCARVRNIGFWVSAPGRGAIMVASHHDSVPTGPGAADDGMGVSASLEIARILRSRDLPRPLYVLITDAEEVGLIGASRFVDHDPVAPLIGAVVSLEARGNRGIANMFETSAPNGRDLAALPQFPGHGTKGPTSNSLAVDIYRAMPNGTDVTEYLELGMDAANYAMVGRPSHYHTPKDDLAHLDSDAVFHIGASALASVEGLMTVTAEDLETDWHYSDILGIGVLALPKAMGLPVIGLGVLLCGVALFRTRGTPVWRALIFPLAALIAGGALAWLSGWGIDLIRPEPAHGTAYPVALRGLLLASALLGACLTARWLYRPDGADRALAGAWAVLLTLGSLASLVFPGIAVLFVFPALLALPGAILLLFGLARAARILFALGSLLLLALVLPLHAVAETSLFVEASAPLTLVMLFVFITALPLMWRAPGSSRRALAGTALVAAGFAVAALFVPAYTAGEPRGLNLLHLDGDRMDTPVLTIGTRGPVPNAMADAAPFERLDLPGFGGPYHATPVADARLQPGTVSVLTDTRSDSGRRLRLRILAPDADIVELRAEGDAPPAIEQLILEDQSLDDTVFPRLSCTGRACRELTLDMVLRDPDAEPTLVLSVTRYGLDESADTLLAARPDWAVPKHRGDRRVMRTHVTLGSE